MFAPRAVSVSTSGSKGVQPPNIYRFNVTTNAFQYPQADRRGCNFYHCFFHFFTPFSFSIHKRIEGGATYRFVDVRRALSVEFQYPQADRRGCNGHQRPILCKVNSVSVSTSGSKGVQQFHLSLQNSFDSQFQYPQADRRGCNVMRMEIYYIKYRGFSIHKRIEGGATQAWLQYIRREYLFQYPQADRRGCNGTGHDIAGRPRQVSVSTSGSKGVQRFILASKIVLIVSFSIHKRIEGGATWRRSTSSSPAMRVSVSTSGSKGVQRRR